MAFEQRTWTDRQVQFPGRRTLTDTENPADIQTVYVTRNEGTVTNVGDLFQAGELDPNTEKYPDGTMNGLEQRIAKAFESVRETIGTLLDSVYPIGSIFISYSDNEQYWPANLFPGTYWEHLASDRVLLPVPISQASGQNTGNTNGNKVTFTPTAGLGLGGSVGYTALNINQIPSHTHTFRALDEAVSGSGKAVEEYNSGTRYRFTTSKVGIRSEGNGQAHNHNFIVSGSIAFKPITIDITQPYVTVHAWRRKATP